MDVTDTFWAQIFMRRASVIYTEELWKLPAATIIFEWVGSRVDLFRAQISADQLLIVAYKNVLRIYPARRLPLIPI